MIIHVNLSTASKIFCNKFVMVEAGLSIKIKRAKIYTFDICSQFFLCNDTIPTPAIRPNPSMPEGSGTS